MRAWIVDALSSYSALEAISAECDRLITYGYPISVLTIRMLEQMELKN